MTNRYNPFMPSNPVYPGMFAGRIREINSVEKMLTQTRYGNPSNLLFIGERGIGKTSLLLFTEYLAKGELDDEGEHNNFLTVRIALDSKTTIEILALKIKNEIERELKKENITLARINAIWDFVKKLDVSTPIGGVRIADRAKEGTKDYGSELIYSILDTIEAITLDTTISEVGLTKKKDGLVLLIDEADKASEELQLGSLLKSLSETLGSKGKNNLLIILAGLPTLREILIKSHESALRLFLEFDLNTLDFVEVKRVIENGIEESNNKLSPEMDKLTISSDAIDSIFEFSEGYPHFVQQIAYSALEENNDGVISKEDVIHGFFKKEGALDQIGSRYYRHLFYQCSMKQREVLAIMAESWKNWVKREEIKKKFKGNVGALDNSLKVLRDKRIIIPKEGSRGEYRLQLGSFAFWLKWEGNKKSQ